jgi:amidase
VDAGFVLLGKTATSEFAALPFTESEALGNSRNPWDPDRTPGGSSSGAGVAVAAGMAPIAHATDGGGSIRILASCNGLVGLKPTRGLVTNVAIDWIATSAVRTRSVADTAAALDVLARHDPAAWWSPPTPPRSFASAITMAPPTGLRIGVLADSPIDGINVDPVCVAAVGATLRTLDSAGHHVVDAPLPRPRQMTSSRPSRRYGTSAVPGFRSRTRTASSPTTGPCVTRHERSTRGPTQRA